MRRLASLVAVLAVPLMSCSGATGFNPHGGLGSAQLHMVDARHGWAFGQHLIARTDDGAATFRDVTPDITGSMQLSSPDFVDASRAWVMVVELDGSTLLSSTLERTEDGGVSWAATPIRPALDGDVTFFDSSHGWMTTGHEVANHTAVDQKLWRTVDGGKSWSDVFEYTRRLAIEPNVQKGDCTFSAISWTSPTRGLAGLSCPFDIAPAVEVTNDGGSTWTKSVLPSLPAQAGIALYSSVGTIPVLPGGMLATFVARCVGDDGNSCRDYGELNRSRDGGVTWTHGALVWGAGDALMADADHAWLPDACPTDQCGGPALLVTSNGGVSWQPLAMPRELWPNMHGSRIYSLVSATVGFVVVSNEFQASPVFYRTTDGGHTFGAFSPKFVAWV